MTRDDIIKMAKEAGAYAPKYPIGPHDVQFSVASLEHFFRMAQELGKPEREWRGLTDEEIHDMNGYEEDRRMYRFARAIEAKLKEKNT